MLAAEAHRVTDPAQPAIAGRRGNRERILREAREMLRQGSYLAFTVEGVARACGLSRQTVYNQFDDKDALYRESRLALLDAFLFELRARLALAGPPSADVARLIQACLPVLSRAEHVELSRSAELDGAAMPWVASLYRRHVEWPIEIAALRCLEARQGPAPPGLHAAHSARLVTMLRAAAQGCAPAPAFSAAELARIFLDRLAPPSPAEEQRAMAAGR